MPVDLKVLQKLIKQGAQASADPKKNLSPGNQAMMNAGQSLGRIPGQTAVSSDAFVSSGAGDPAGDALAQQEAEKEVEDAINEKDQENEKLRHEKQTLEAELAQVRIEKQQSDAANALAQERAKFDKDMQAQTEALERDRAQFKAQQTEHKAILAQQTSEQKAEIAKERSDMMQELANEQAQRYVKTTDEIAKNMARQKEQAEKHLDDYKSNVLASIDEARPSVSPALKSQMEGAIAAVNSVGKIKDRMHSIPKPGSPPVHVQTGMAENQGLMGKTAGSTSWMQQAQDAATRSRDNAAAQVAWDRYKEAPTYRQQEQAAQGRSTTTPWVTAAATLGPIVMGGLLAGGGRRRTAPPPQEELPTDVVPGAGSGSPTTALGVDPDEEQGMPLEHSASWNAPAQQLQGQQQRPTKQQSEPAASTAMSPAQHAANVQRMLEQRKQKGQAMNPGQQVKVASGMEALTSVRTILPVPGGMPKSARYSLAQQSKLIAQLTDALSSTGIDDVDKTDPEYKKRFNTLNADQQALLTQRERLQAQLNKEWRIINDLRNKGGRDANGVWKNKAAAKELAEYNDLHRTYTDRSGRWAWIKGLWGGNPESSAYKDIAERSKRQAEKEAIEKAYDDAGIWGSAKKLINGIGDFALGWTNTIGDSVDGYYNLKGMAEDRGVSAWGNEDSEDPEMYKHMQEAAKRYNISSNPWAHIGNAAYGVGEGALALGSFGAAGVGVGALTRAGKAYRMVRGTEAGSRAGQAAIKRLIRNPNANPQLLKEVNAALGAERAAKLGTHLNAMSKPGMMGRLRRFNAGRVDKWYTSALGQGAILAGANNIPGWVAEDGGVPIESQWAPEYMSGLFNATNNSDGGHSIYKNNFGGTYGRTSGGRRLAQLRSRLPEDAKGLLTESERVQRASDTRRAPAAQRPIKTSEQGSAGSTPADAGNVPTTRATPKPRYDASKALRKPLEKTSSAESAAASTAPRVEHSARPINMGANSALDWNRNGGARDITASGMSNYFNRKGPISMLMKMSPLISSLTNGVVNFTRSPELAYNSAKVVNPQTLAAAAFQPSSDPRFTSGPRYLSQASAYLNKQFQAANPETPTVYQATYKQLDGSGGGAGNA